MADPCTDWRATPQPASDLLEWPALDRLWGCRQARTTYPHGWRMPVLPQRGQLGCGALADPAADAIPDAHAHTLSGVTRRSLAAHPSRRSAILVASDAY